MPSAKSSLVLLLLIVYLIVLPVYEFVCISLGQIISTVLGQVDHGGQDGNATQTRIRDETSETDHTKNDAFAMVLSTEP